MVEDIFFNSQTPEKSITVLHGECDAQMERQSSFELVVVKAISEATKC
jgi:hypothetical protein